MQNNNIKLGLENFRVFSEYQEFEFAPFTILTGASNSGKSVLHRALYLLTNSIKKDKFGEMEIDNLSFHGIAGKIGDMASNFSYDKDSPVLTVTWGYHSELCYEDFKISLKYDDGKLTEIKFYIVTDNTPHLFLSLAIEDHFWSVQTDWNLDTPYFLKILKKKGERQNRIVELYRKINIKSYTLTREDLKEIKAFEKEGVVFNLHPAQFDDNPVPVDWDVYDKKNKTIYPYNDFLDYAYFSFSPPIEGLFVDSDLLRDIDAVKYFDDDETANSSDTEMMDRLRSTLVLTNIFTKEDLIKKYQEFENRIFNVSYRYIDGYNRENGIFEESLSGFMNKVFSWMGGAFGRKNEIPWKALASDPIYFASLCVENFLNYQDWSYSTKLKNATEEEKVYLMDRLKKSLGGTISLMDSVWSEFVRNIDSFLNSIVFPPVETNIEHRILFDETTNRPSVMARYAKQVFSGDKTDFNEKFIARWLKKFRLGTSIEVEAVTVGDKVIGAEFFLKRQNRKISLSDNSMEANRLIQIILHLAMSEKNSLLLLVNPEANFHPAFQSLFAEFLLDAFKTFGHTFVVESRSEYLVRKFQLLTAQKKISPNDTQIYYFHHPDFIPQGEKQIKKISILPDGALDEDTGEGFFDEPARLTMDLLKMQSQN